LEREGDEPPTRASGPPKPKGSEGATLLKKRGEISPAPKGKKIGPESQKNTNVHDREQRGGKTEEKGGNATTRDEESDFARRGGAKRGARRLAGLLRGEEGRRSSDKGSP